jgi:hypothetical protein
MMMAKKKMNPWVKRLLLAVLLLLITGGIAIWYIFTEKFADTKEHKADYTVNAMSLLNEFQQNDSAANKKYTEKIIVVNGRIGETEIASDSSVNIKIIDTLTDAYIIFAFQQQHLAEAKQLKIGDSISIKGSLSNGVYSEILETYSVNFKRCTLNK